MSPTTSALDSLNGKKVLLCIDDDVHGLAIRKLVLESAGYSVLTARNGADGLKVLQSAHVDAVILDYLMPEMDGHAITTEIRRIKPTLPILILSASLEIPDEVLEAANAFLHKGTAPQELFRSINGLLST
jgi:CheY-like chemotaxis protein